MQELEIQAEITDHPQISDQLSENNSEINKEIRRLHQLLQYNRSLQQSTRKRLDTLAELRHFLCTQKRNLITREKFYSFGDHIDADLSWRAVEVIRNRMSRRTLPQLFFPPFFVASSSCFVDNSAFNSLPPPNCHSIQNSLLKSSSSSKSSYSSSNSNNQLKTSDFEVLAALILGHKLWYLSTMEVLQLRNQVLINCQRDVHRLLTDKLERLNRDFVRTVNYYDEQRIMGEIEMVKVELGSVHGYTLDTVYEKYGDLVGEWGAEKWSLIAEQLPQRYPIECRFRFLYEESPALNKMPWSGDELQRLVGIVSQRFENCGTMDWNEIALEHGNNRLAFECFKEWKRTTPIRCRPWNRDEDEKLRKLVGYHGNAWNEIASYFEDRTGNQCLTRYNKCLNPIYNQRKWSDEENDLLKSAVEFFKRVHGELAPIKWSLISQFVLTRSDLQCRVKWTHSTTANPNSEMKTGGFTEDEKKQLVALVDEYLSVGTLAGQPVPEHILANEYRRPRAKNRPRSIPWSYIGQEFYPNRPSPALRHLYDRLVRKRDWEALHGAPRKRGRKRKNEKPCILNDDDTSSQNSIQYKQGDNDDDEMER